MIDDPHVGPGEKYALIGFRTIRPIGMDPVHLGAGLWACGRLPFALDGNWKEWIGTVREQAIRHANLFLLAKMRSSQVEIRDGENEKLKNQVFRLYQALLLSASVRVFEAVFLLTGAHRESGPEVRELMEPPAPLSIAGATADAVTPAILRLADRSVIAIAELEAIGGFQRIGRMYSIYQRALDNPDHVERLHQFCQCIEGLILPDISRTTTQFRSRTELFVGPRHHNLMGRLYEMRSRVEHLHQLVFDDWPADERERRLIILRESSFLEELSRRCMTHFLSTRDLWPHFRSDDALRQFWSSTTAGRRRELWGEPFDVGELRRRFDEELVSDAYLGL